MKRFLIIPCVLAALLAPASSAETNATPPMPGTGLHDWPQFGRTTDRNMVSPEKDLPDSFEIASQDKPAKNIKWIAHLEGNYVGANNPAIANGKIYIGMKDSADFHNKNSPTRTKTYMPFTCLDEKTGKMLWQLNSTGTTARPKPSTIGNLTVPTIDGNRVYCYRKNLIVCLTANGFNGKNQGPFVDEKKEYGLGDNESLGKTDADIVWTYDVYDQLNVKIDHTLVYAPLVYGNYVYCSSGNSKTGGDDGRSKMKTQDAPCFIVLDKNTGKLVAKENEKIGLGTIRGQWGTPSVGMIDGKAQILFGGGDGVVYAFEPVTEAAVKASSGILNLKKIWSFNINTHWKYKNIRTGPPPTLVSAQQEYVAKKLASPDRKGILLGAPVCHNNRVFINLSDDWGAGPTVWPFWATGRIVCIDATKTGDVTETGVIWENSEIGISEATVSVSDGLVYTTDVYGKLHCFDELTGKYYWAFDGKNPCYSSPLAADGKVYYGNSKGDFFILKAGKELKLLSQTSLIGDMSGPLAVANGVLYVVAKNNLYAIQKGATGGQEFTPVKTKPKSTPAAPGSATEGAPATGSGPVSTAAPESATGAVWPCLRGENGRGVSSFANPPTSWDASKNINIKWKTEIALPGLSSPVVACNKVLITGATKGENRVFCFDLENGKLLWNQKANACEREAPDVAADTGNAPNTMALDEKHAFAVFPTGDLNCFDLDGKEIWHKDLGTPANTYGFAASLLIDEKCLYVQFDDSANGKMVAFNKDTGDIVWSKPRALASWSSPVFASSEGRKLIIAAAPTVMAYDAATGNEIWQNACMDGDVAPSPAVDNGLAFVVTANSKLSALDLKSGETKWDSDDTDAITGIPSPVADNGMLYLCNESGNVVCMEDKSGKILWKKAFATGFNASPIAAGGMIYFLDLNGLMTVIKAGAAYAEVAKNPLGEECHATPAFAGKRIIIRGTKNIYCIEESGK